jgi:ABC-type transport system substrate-binding protein
VGYRRVGALLLPLVLMLAVTACGSDKKEESSSSATSAPAAAATSAPGTQAPAAGEKPVRGGTLTVGLASDIANLDPVRSSLFVDRLVQYNVYDSLVTVNEKLEIKPGLAASSTPRR